MALTDEQCKLCGGKGYTNVHQSGHTHYETDYGEPCPVWHYKQVACVCKEVERLKEENARLDEELKSVAGFYNQATELAELRRLENKVFRAELAESQRKERADWQPIETVPKDGTRVLLAWDGIVMCVDAVDSESFFYPDNPTHWMPLPAPPIEAAISQEEKT